jgi:aminopeptidase-like protein
MLTELILYKEVIDVEFNIKNKFDNIGEQIYNVIEELFPICRSITGNGVRESLKIIQKQIPIEIKEIPSGKKAYDWKIPKEWNIEDAYIKNSTGEKIVDFQKSNLHVVNYSIPVNGKFTLDELKKHLHTLPNNPEWIPYLTTYYNEDWGFCVSENQLNDLKDEEYKVVIDSKLNNGSLTYGELIIPGISEKRILLSCYVCHPSMCNDNLTGPALLTLLAKYIKDKELEYTYHFLFIPETIGAIAWLSQNEEIISKIKCGLVATCLGDSGISTYKKTKNGNSIIDRIVEKVLQESKLKFKIIDFFPSGSDERQFSSLGFNLEIGSLMKTMYGKFPEYHTSADNLEFINKNSLHDSFEKYLNVILMLENNKIYRNLNPKCEPQLGRKGIYRLIGSQKNEDLDELSILWVLNMTDGVNSLLDISERSGIKFQQIQKAAQLLFDKKLLEVI